MKKFIAAPFGNYIKTKNTISVSGSWTVEKRTGRIIQIVKTLRYTKRGWKQNRPEKPWNYYWFAKT